LFSLAAKFLGAKVHSFDYDSKSVMCAKYLKEKYFWNDDNWKIEVGSVLDNSYLTPLGDYDIVYSWGVLHHTGDMWTALENIEKKVGNNGVLCIAIYNDQGKSSKVWWKVKKIYISLPNYLRWIVLTPCYIRLWGPSFVRDFISLKPFKTWRDYKDNRGMSPHRDLIDWVGGFPFEVAKAEDIFNFYKQKNYHLTSLKTCAGGIGCNEFVFQKSN